MFEPEYVVARLKGAEYNPRTITDDAERALAKSIDEIGFAKPVLVTTDGTLIAGHQRTNAARRLGRQTVPAYIIGELELGHEMRFNQIHNGADVDDQATAEVPPSKVLGFVDVAHERIECAFDQPGAPRRHEIYHLVAKYGPWGSSIATESGEVLSSQQYAITSKIAALPLRVFYVPDSKREAVLRHMGRQYGEFSYARLPRNPWVQAYAQPGRPVGNEVSAWLFRERVLPELRKGERLLDFGCGVGDSVKMLQARGHRALGLEFFFKGSSDSIKPSAVRAMIDRVCEDLAEHGLFDVVVADSVLNSVDSEEAAGDVLTCLNALCRPGGRLYFSGRPLHLNEIASLKKVARENRNRRRVEFVDAKGFSALPRGDKWFFQKFHSKEQVESMADRYIGPIRRVSYQQTRWDCGGRKTAELEPRAVLESLQREFDLPWPEGRSVDRGAAIVAAWERARRLSAKH